MTHHDHEVVERGSSAVASVAIVVLVIIAILAVVAFGGLNWLRNNGGGANEGASEGDNNPSVLPTVPMETVMPPAPESYNRPGMGARSTG